MALRVEDNCIYVAGYKLENWRQVNWLVNLIEVNAEVLWGKRAIEKAETATILRLVDKETDPT